MSCALCPTPFAQQHLKLLGPPNSGRSVAEWAPSLKRATDACVLASNNASLPGAEGPPEGCTTAPRHAACGGPLPSSAEGPCVILPTAIIYSFIHEATPGNRLGSLVACCEQTAKKTPGIFNFGLTSGNVEDERARHSAGQVYTGRGTSSRGLHARSGPPSQ